MKPTATLLSTAIALLAASPLAAFAQEAIPAEQAVRHVGKEGMVCGKVEKTRYAQNSEGEPTFLYMGGAFPRHTFSARIPGDQRNKFKPTPEELEGRDVCIIGTIKRDASRAEVEVTSPASIKLATIK
ncbi:hypothetical protein B1992_14965 [Pseudoxanthomonas broegbernensis]|uniref:Secreted protein n=1 Tax=Pseudoxanthomonas broegbernensis TaxID=83619 RepID=A0A7V8K656_9GAMM|nr:hypothetical protein [Pseudoxanthomonas broegbernensis]KAF1684566.1 hypothetical protein B1992_14965 [Pseudoxanthomonas broegbernensis]MBB6066487.1 hypothetical protein [Pseudoxanthomonas broegbernensis]